MEQFNTILNKLFNVIILINCLDNKYIDVKKTYKIIYDIKFISEILSIDLKY